MPLFSILEHFHSLIDHPQLILAIGIYATISNLFLAIPIICTLNSWFESIGKQIPLDPWLRRANQQFEQRKSTMINIFAGSRKSSECLKKNELMNQHFTKQISSPSQFFRDERKRRKLSGGDSDVFPTHLRWEKWRRYASVCQFTVNCISLDKWNGTKSNGFSAILWRKRLKK